MNLDVLDLQALFLTFKLACITTTILFVLGLPIAWWLSRTESKFKPVLEALIALPLVLPPTVLGFYLLLAMGANGWLGKLWLSLFDTTLAFSFTGLIIGSAVYSLPFVVQPLQSAFSNVSRELMETAAALGAGFWDRFWTVALPSARNGALTAVVLGFAHTLGEFGVVLMIGGNIAGETKVVSIAIYEHVETLNYASANGLSVTLLLISFSLLLTLFVLNRNSHKSLLGSAQSNA